MRSLLLAASCLMVNGLALALEDPAASAPPETVSMVYVVLFGLVFVGMIVGFLAYLFLRDEGKGKPQK